MPTTDDPDALRMIRAAWVAPMDGPVLRDGAVVMSAGRILAVGDARRLSRLYMDAAVHDAGRAVLLPGLVNAHAHLELTRFAREPLPAGGFVDWVLALRERAMAAAAAAADLAGEAAAAAVRDGVAQCLRFGVTCVGDVARQVAGVRRALRESPLRGVSFGEVLGMAGRADQSAPMLAAATDRRAERDGLRAGVEPHAPYSLDLAGYRRCVTAAGHGRFPVTTHLAETPDEAAFLADHAGPFRRLWDALGGWSDGGAAVTRFDGGPVRAMKHVGLLDLPADAPVVLAHVNYCDDDELHLLAGSATTSVAYCPRTHAYFGHPPHRWREMLARGINVAVGTDSCASSPDLNLVDDLRLLHRLAPDVPPATLWEMATARGARALGMQGEAGTLSPGKAADAVAFPVRGRDPLREVLEGDAVPSAVWARGRRVG